MSSVMKYEKDVQEKAILTEMIKTLKDLHINLHVDDITSYFTERMQSVVSNDEEDAYSMSYIDDVITQSSVLLNANVKLLVLIDKYNKLKN